MIRSGRSSAQAITRARILLKIDEGWTAPQVIGKGRVSYAIGKAGKGPRLPCKRRRQSASHGRLDSTPAPTGESELRSRPTGVHASAQSSHAFIFHRNYFEYEEGRRDGRKTDYRSRFLASPGA